MKTIIALIALLSITAFGQTDNQSVKKSFLIINSSKNYSKSLKKAQKAANSLGIPMNLRNMYENPEGGLSSSETCGCGEQHGYIPRGRGDDGKYISIEYSSAFLTFKKLFYIVVVASGERDELTKLLPEIRKYYPDAYIKDSPVYMGCMH